jgi:hypothetical protein
MCTRNKNKSIIWWDLLLLDKYSSMDIKMYNINIHRTIICKKILHLLILEMQILMAMRFVCTTKCHGVFNFSTTFVVDLMFKLMWFGALTQCMRFLCTSTTTTHFHLIISHPKNVPIFINHNCKVYRYLISGGIDCRNHRGTYTWNK